MKPKFSEFSYGFALSFEITYSLRNMIKGAPIFPSLIEEASLGYDVNFSPVGWPLFLQFKLSDYLKGNSKQYKYYSSSYYRIEVRPLSRSKQHNLLCDLARNEPDTYYAAPAFFTENDFSSAFSSNAVFQRSVFVPLSLLPRITDSESHYITFQDASGSFRWHSEGSSEIEGVFSGGQFLNYLQRNQHEPHHLDVNYFRRLRSSLLNIMGDNDTGIQFSLFSHQSETSLSEEPLEVIRDVHYVLAVYFGVELFFIEKRIEQGPMGFNS